MNDIPKWAVNGMFWPQRAELQRMKYDPVSSGEESREKIKQAATAEEALDAIVSLLRSQRSRYVDTALNSATKPKDQFQCYGAARVLTILLEDIGHVRRRRDDQRIG
jgi:hypothetical protein